MKEGTSTKINIDGVEFTVSFKDYRLSASSPPIDISKVGETPIADLIRVEYSNGKYNIFDLRKPKFKERTIRINDTAYAIVGGS